MHAEQCLQQGRLEEALAELQGEVRKSPADPKLRVFLFQLLSVLGQWERALTQLQVAGELDAANLLMAQMYREAIRCELFRAQVFAGKQSPLVFGDPAPWIAFLVEALRLDADGRCAEAEVLRATAFEQAPATAGSANGHVFDWIADADSRLGPVLEAIVNGRYYWIPFQCINRLEIEVPADLRDVVWMPAQFTWSNGGGASGLIPSRYAGTESAEDPLLKLSRRSEWQELGGGAFKGLGQRILATNQDDYALMDVREIRLEPAKGEAS